MLRETAPPSPVTIGSRSGPSTWGSARSPSVTSWLSALEVPRRRSSSSSAVGSRGGSSAARSPERSRTPATRRRRAHQVGVGDAPSTKPDEARPCGIEDVSFAVGHGRFSLVPCQLAEALDQAGGQLTLHGSDRNGRRISDYARNLWARRFPASAYFMRLGRD